MKNIIKKGIQTLAAFALVFSLAFVVAQPAFAASDVNLSTGYQSAQGANQPEELTGTGGVFETIVNVLLFIIGAISVIMIIVGGIRYTTSGGDQAAVQAAKNTILYAVIGLIVAILAYAVVNWVVNSFQA